MASLNKVFLIGNLTRDPELRYTPSGTAVAKIGLAMNRRYRDKTTNEMREEVTFVDIEAWARQAELAGQYLHKGRPVFIEGRLRLDRWQNQDGQNRSRMLVVAENIQFLGSRDDASGRPNSDGASYNAPRNNAPAARPPQGNAPAGYDDMPPDDDIPF